PRFRRLPVLGSFFFESRRYSPEASLRIILSAPPARAYVPDYLVFHRRGLTVILSLTTTPTCAVFASSTARERTASDATVPDSVTSFFVTSARTSRSVERTCSSCANIDWTAFSSWAFAALGLPGPIGEDAALASGSNLEASSTLIPTSARTITKKLLGFMAGASARFWRRSLCFLSFFAGS